MYVLNVKFGSVIIILDPSVVRTMIINYSYFEKKKNIND